MNRVYKEQSCLTWFYNTFYHRVRILSINCPVESNNKFFLNIIRCILCGHQGVLRQEHVQILMAGIERHCVTFCDVCMIGGVLFTTLQECLGVEFTSEIKASWVKLYSALLRDVAKLMIPIQQDTKMLLSSMH